MLSGKSSAVSSSHLWIDCGHWRECLASCGLGYINQLWVDFEAREKSSVQSHASSTLQNGHRYYFKLQLTFLHLHFSLKESECERSTLKGESFTHRGVYHWRVITFPSCSGQNRAQLISEKEMMTEKWYCQAANSHFITLLFCGILVFSTSSSQSLQICCLAAGCSSEGK